MSNGHKHYDVVVIFDVEGISRQDAEGQVKYTLKKLKRYFLWDFIVKHGTLKAQ